MKRNFFRLIFLITVSAVISCDVNHNSKSSSGYTIDGGSCRYDEFYGNAKIISIKSADPKDYNCKNDPVEVTFNFIPDDPGRISPYPDSNQKLVVGSGQNPSRKYIADKGIIEGKTYPCKKMEIKKGTCTPVIFDFYKINFSDYMNICF